MAIYVYTTATGALVSWIPESLTIAQAQASGQLASAAVLATHGLSAVDNLPALDDSHVWNVTTKTVNTITPPTPANVVNTYDFIMAFTSNELSAIRTSSDVNVQQFLFAMQVTQGVNLNADTMQTALQYLVNKSLLAPARVATISATVKSNTATGTP